MKDNPSPPSGDGSTGLEILKGLLRERSLLVALSLMQKRVGDAFQIPIPGFKPAVMVGPETNRQILVSERHKVLWRNETDPVTDLLRHGVLVVDGEEHDEIRGVMDPLLHRGHILAHIPTFWKYTGQVTASWQAGESRDMLVEMRKIALLILFESLFRVDLTPDLERLWHPVLHLIEYISPGLWILFPRMPRARKYLRARQVMDQYLFAMIRQRRAELERNDNTPSSEDLLSTLVRAEGMSDDLIRDQLLTMLIAGHDTSTALLAWTLYLLGMHPEAMLAARNEVDSVFGGIDQPPEIEKVNKLIYLDMVIKETLRLYPPIHVGNRRLAQEMTLHGYRVPAGARLMCSIYLSHRHEQYWPEPESFKPERFNRQNEESRPPLTYIPFGGGPRNCIGAAYAQVESKVVLARLLQSFDLELLNGQEIKPYMGATLEPRPGVWMGIMPRETGTSPV